MNDNKDVKLAFNISEDIKILLEAEAKKLGLSLASFCRMALMEAVREKRLDSVIYSEDRRKVS